MKMLQNSPNIGDQVEYRWCGGRVSATFEGTRMKQGCPDPWINTEMATLQTEGVMGRVEVPLYRIKETESGGWTCFSI